jgi:hypothetical protein
MTEIIPIGSMALAYPPDAADPERTPVADITRM